LKVANFQIIARSPCDQSLKIPLVPMLLGGNRRLDAPGKEDRLRVGYDAGAS
jgi:hypothetical protein